MAGSARPISPALSDASTSRSACHQGQRKSRRRSPARSELARSSAGPSRHCLRLWRHCKTTRPEEIYKDCGSHPVRSASVMASGRPSQGATPGLSLRRRPALGSGGLDAGGPLQAQLGDGGLAHLELLDLAGDRHREGVHEPPVAGDLEGGDLSPAPLAQLVAVHRLALLEPHPGAQLLAVSGVGNAYDLHVADLWFLIYE